MHRGLAPDLVWLVAELAVSPFAHALQRTLFGRAAAAPTLRDALDAWNHGYCPACGSWPALAEVVGGHRTLRCSFCAGAWELTTYACIYCEESGEAFVTAAPDEERKDRRIEVCAHCGGYLKTDRHPASCRRSRCCRSPTSRRWISTSSSCPPATDRGRCRCTAASPLFDRCRRPPQPGRRRAPRWGLRPRVGSRSSSPTSSRTFHPRRGCSTTTRPRSARVHLGAVYVADAAGRPGGDPRSRQAESAGFVEASDVAAVSDGLRGHGSRLACRIPASLRSAPNIAGTGDL